MSELIPSIPLSKFKKLKASEIERLKSCEITSDGQYLCTIVRPQTDYIRTKAEYMAQLSNSVGGQGLEEILKEEVAV